MMRSTPWVRAAVLSLAVLAAAAAPAFALDGRVVDKRTGSPVAGAEVMIVGLTGSVKTDGDGRFSWKPNPAPPFEVLVILPGGKVTGATRITSNLLNPLNPLNLI